MNGRQIEIFHAIMRTGTVTEAAQRLRVTQPAITASLKQTEAILGFNLFHRTGGRLHPTAAARTLYAEAERIQDSLDVFRNLAKRLKKDLTDHLRIATPPTFSHDLIPDAIAKFKAKNNDCILDITTRHHDHILSDVQNPTGHTNLGFTFGLGDRPGLGMVHIGTVKISALIPVNWSIANQDEVTVNELAEHPIIGTFAGEPLSNAVEQMMLKNGVGFDSDIRVHNHSVAAKLASKGLGATIIDSITAAHALSYYDQNQFKLVPIQDAPDMQVFAVYSYEHPLNKNAKLFIDAFRQCLKAL